MSIATRIESIEEHIEQAYDELQGLGADLTGIDKNIDNIASVLDDLYNDLPKVTGSGTSITLDDTRKGRLESTLSGNTSQETTTGKNLIGTNYITGVTVNNAATNDITIRGNWASTIVSNANLLNILEPSTTYTISYKYKVLERPSSFGTNNSVYILGLYDGSSGLTFFGETQKNTIALNTWETITKTFTTPASLTNYRMIAYDFKDANNTTTGSIEISELQIEKGSSATSFEPYTNGASPNPSYPQPVNVVNGDNEINVVGKNLLPISTLSTTTKNGITFTNNNDGSYTFNGTASAYTTFVLNNNLSFNGNYTYVMRDTATSGFTMYLQSSSGQGIGQATTHTTIDNSIGIMVIGINNGVSLNNVTIKPYVYKGAYDSTIEYEPYQGNTYNIDLPEDMELCKIGNYQDYFYKDSGKWYLHREIGKVVYNGSESWEVSSSYQGIYQMQTSKGDVMYVNDTITRVLSNYFEGTWWSSSWTRNNSIVLGNGLIRVMTSDYTTTDAFKAWLSTHNLIVYYVLATPTNTKITYEPLLEQLEAYYHAKSRATQTNISQENNDLPFIISASALKEWQENTSLNSTLSMVNPLSLGNTLNTQENNIQPIEVDNIEPLEEEENEES